MDKRPLIQKVFERDMQKAVQSIARCENRIFNMQTVFRIETGDKPYIFKLYRSADYPEEGKLLFVSKKLAQQHIPHAEIFVYKRNDADFPNGYLIEECLPGISADRLVLSEEETCILYQKLAVMLSDIHQIRFTNYGFLIGGEPDCASFTQHLEKHFLYGNHHIQSAYSEAALQNMKHILVAKLQPCDNMQPCLCHMDLQLKNMLVDREAITLIDWDDARCFPAIVDVARLTLLIELAYDNEKAELATRAARYQAAFLVNYNLPDGLACYPALAPALHVWHGLILLNFCSPDTPQFWKIKTHVDQKLKGLG